MATDLGFWVMETEETDTNGYTKIMSSAEIKEARLLMTHDGDLVRAEPFIDSDGEASVLIRHTRDLMIINVSDSYDTRNPFDKQLTEDVLAADESGDLEILGQGIFERVVEVRKLRARLREVVPELRKLREMVDTKTGWLR